MLLLEIFLSSNNSSTSRRGKTCAIKHPHVFKYYLFIYMVICRAVLLVLQTSLAGRRDKYIPEECHVVNLTVASQRKTSSLAPK